ncbi:hypothetical protein E3P77_04127 [Wallemia ichthyophaga]|uniref:Uncharacterized protein n=2 Tax=Wallemia ichthyophaga TaxID=245174 RepID=A0A4T0ETP1_WALIC|nr:uncharacterized protein J056_000525 [Wallemia ichthyophaga EXF-994]TIA77626.1 hypothetical protein E3P98_04122 [Wallemia ichthyophaga]EOR00715.1 hypothetical protein J056_000525 [Wallemia ichthyophaga EXF-994]TIA95178.1 hypothetical protein E3P94_04126 [Wallemia ichthyophaga]TIB06983.1 hypothetical protein E3P93_04099 [Wallemia ichthyophaga]TIB07358.1 hypothetical protein E3P90_04096 [Wallemia ichthyophaga]
MYHFGDPEWYDKHIEPAKTTFWPKEEDTNKPAKDPESLKSQLQQLKSKRKTSSDSAQIEESQPQRLV